MSVPQIWFATFGLVVLDELRFPDGKIMTDIIGGSGTYSALGARMFLPPPQSRSVGWLIHVGNDFPHTVREQLELWDTTLLLRKDPGRLSLRGCLKYEDAAFGREINASVHMPPTIIGSDGYIGRQFQYLTPVLAVLPIHLKSTSLLSSRVFHFLGSPADVEAQIQTLLRLRTEEGILERPVFIWEPAPPSCTHRDFSACVRVAGLVDILSPNHIELASLCAEHGVLDRPMLEQLSLRFLDGGIGLEGRGAIIVRAGEQGCFVHTRAQPPAWLPAYHQATDSPTSEASLASNKVVDPTGAGNSFLGALAIGLLETDNLIEAACYGAVAASYTIEQIGLPTLQKETNGEEVWNGTSVRARLRKYKDRLETAVEV